MYVWVLTLKERMREIEHTHTHTHTHNVDMKRRVNASFMSMTIQTNFCCLLASALNKLTFNTHTRTCAVSLVHKALSRALKALLKRPITEALLFDSYAKVAATFDEIVYAGIVENLQEETVRRGSKLKLSAADQ